MRTSSSGSNQSCIIINSDNCNLNNVKVKRGTHAGVVVNDADNLYMKGCVIEHFTTGSGWGLCIMGNSHENTFESNFIYDCNVNVHIMGTANENTLKDNVLHDALVAGLHLEAGTTHTYIHADNIIANNAVDIIDEATGTYYHALYQADFAANRVWEHSLSEHVSPQTYGHAVQNLEYVGGTVYLDTTATGTVYGTQQYPHNNFSEALD